MTDLLTGLGARSAPIQRAPENIAQARQQGWEIAVHDEISRNGMQLVVALPPSEAGLEGAALAEYARTSPMVLLAWSEESGRFTALTPEEKEMALLALEQGTTLDEQEEIRRNQEQVEEFGKSLDDMVGFDPSSALYDLYRSGVFSYIESQPETQLREGYREELMSRLSGVEGLDFEKGLEEETKLRDFLQGFLTVFSEGSVYHACLFGFQYFARIEPEDRLSAIVASAIEEYAGIPQEFLKELKADGRLSRPMTEDEFRELLADPRVPRLSEQDWALPPGQEDRSESERAMRFFMDGISSLRSAPSEEVGEKYAYLYSLWTIAHGDDLLADANAYLMAREFYRVTGLEINSEAVRDAWQEYRYAMR